MRFFTSLNSTLESRLVRFVGPFVRVLQTAVKLLRTLPGRNGLGSDVLVLKYIDRWARIVRDPDNTLPLSFAGMPGATNRLQFSGNLFDWVDLETLVADPDGMVTYDTLVEPAVERKWFRTVTP